MKVEEGRKQRGLENANGQAQGDPRSKETQGAQGDLSQVLKLGDFARESAVALKMLCKLGSE